MTEPTPLDADILAKSTTVAQRAQQAATLKHALAANEACFDMDHAGRHGVAALCLYEQPFGFTREDVELLEDLVPSASRHLVAPVIAKIRALLPPQVPA